MQLLICFGSSVDPDQLASEKPADQDPHTFWLYSTCILYNVHANINNWKAAS